MQRDEIEQLSNQVILKTKLIHAYFKKMLCMYELCVVLKLSELRQAHWVKYGL